MVFEHDPAAALAEAGAVMRACTRCPELVASRSQVVIGTGSPEASVLVVADTPRAREDELGVPLTGRARDLLERLLESGGCSPAAWYLSTLVKCLPPQAREASAAEAASCSEHLEVELGLLRPVVVVALGGVVAGVLRGRTAPIRGLHGRPEPRLFGALPVWLLPVFHPAAALYDPAAVTALTADLAQLPELVARGRPEVEPEPPVAAVPEASAPAGPGQLGLF